MNDVAVAVVARQASGTAFENFQLPMLERLGGDLGAGALGEGYLVQEPVSASFFSHELRAIGIEDGTGEAVAVEGFAAGELRQVSFGKAVGVLRHVFEKVGVEKM